MPQNTQPPVAICAKTGVRSLAPVGLLSCAQLRKLDDTLTSSDVQALHAAATKANHDAVLLEKKILTRASPLLPQAIKLGIQHPDVSLHDYKEWFGGRAAKFAAPGSVARCSRRRPTW